MSGMVYLVGAGCAPGLITVRGMALLRACDAVVHDDLIDSALIDAAPEGAERLYVGKRGGRRSMAQSEINGLLIGLAQTGKRVVRLKGGDPFVFGRGGEEATALRKAGVPFEVVPGVTSAVAMPALAGIPVTHRGLSQSVHIVTAHTADTPDGLPEYMDQLARLPGTLVFLMGLGQLEQVAARLMEAGMDSAAPAAVVSGAGDAGHPQTVRGALADIASRTRAADLRPPAVIVVGAAAAMELVSPGTGPLGGVRVGLVGTDRVTGPLSEALTALGAENYIAARAIPRPLAVDEALEALVNGEPGWVVFTSGSGVERFFAVMEENRLDVRRLAHFRFAVIGPATGKTLAAHGVYADLCPAQYTSRALAEALLDAVGPGEPIYLLRSAAGNRELPRMLEETHPVTDVALYDIASDQDAAKAARGRLWGTDYMLFSSACGVGMYFDAHGALPEGTVPVCIGPVTVSALEKRWSGPCLTAGHISVRGLAETVLNDMKRSKP